MAIIRKLWTLLKSKRLISRILFWTAILLIVLYFGGMASFIIWG
jgi:hypothetical protein